MQQKDQSMIKLWDVMKKTVIQNRQNRYKMESDTMLLAMFLSPR